MKTKEYIYRVLRDLKLFRAVERGRRERLQKITFAVRVDFYVLERINKLCDKHGISRADFGRIALSNELARWGE